MNYGPVSNAKKNVRLLLFNFTYKEVEVMKIMILEWLLSDIIVIINYYFCYVLILILTTEYKSL